MTSPPVVLTIGGSDSGGCYGVQTDLRVFAARGVHAASVLTVVTAQNTVSLRAAMPLPVELVEAQLEAVLDDLSVAAVKTGMLGRVEIIDLVARFAAQGRRVLARPQRREPAAQGRCPNLVVDPVLVDRHGRSLFDPAVADAYQSILLPHAAVTCPNEHELALLDVNGAEALARRIGVPVLVTGGRTGGDEAVDVLWDGTEPLTLRSPRIDTANNAGSGDALSAHLAAGFAVGLSLRESLTEARSRVLAALEGAAGWALGAGPGPLDHRTRP